MGRTSRPNEMGGSPTVREGADPAAPPNPAPNAPKRIAPAATPPHHRNPCLRPEGARWLPGASAPGEGHRRPPRPEGERPINLPAHRRIPPVYHTPRDQPDKLPSPRSTPCPPPFPAVISSPPVPPPPPPSSPPPPSG